MRPILTACDRCGLREVRHELEKKGVIIKFCDECYWGEISEAGGTPEAPGEKPPTGKPARSARKTS